MKISKTKIAVVVIGLGLAIATVRAEDNEARIADAKMAELFEASFANEVLAKYDLSLNDVLKILRMNPGHYIANLRAGWLSYLNGQHRESIAFYNKARALKPNAVEPLLGLMLPMMAARMWSEAEQAAQKILQKAPSDYLAGSRLAYIYFSQGKYGKAEAQYAKVLADYPSDVEMMLGLGWTCLRQGKKVEAKAAFEEVLKIRRKNANARAGLEAL